MSTGKSEKPPRIKGLVKRCRSFKEDILSRLARNRSFGGPGDNHGSHSGVQSPTGWTSDTDNSISGRAPGNEPHVSISHRLKEAYLTIQFVESLIQKNCMDLLGGSSNVMLDLMCYILGEVKKVSSTDSAVYHSTISQVKEALSEFLTSVDVLLLRDQKIDQDQDGAENELYFQKLLNSLQRTKEALNSLKLLVDSKENGGDNNGMSSNLSTPKKSLRSDHTCSRNSSSSSSSNHAAGTGGEVLNTHHKDPHRARDERKPPLPPKLKQWTAKSFDTIDWSTNHSHASGVPGKTSGGGPLHSGHASRPELNQSNVLPGSSSISTTFLNQWLDQPSLTSLPGQFSSSNTGNVSYSTSHIMSEQTSRSDLSSSDLNSSVTSVGLPYGGKHQHHRKSSNVLEVASCTSLLSPSQQWVESSASSAKHAAYNSSGSSAVFSKLHTSSGKKTRTFSDSYRLDSDESLDRLLLVDDSRSQSAATTHSQSLSLGSSLDNLLLVDSQSQQSGLSPSSVNNATQGRINQNSNRTNDSCADSNSAAELASLSTFDPDAASDADVFGLPKSQYSSCYTRNTRGVPERNDTVPPALPEKQSRKVLINAAAENCMFLSSVDFKMSAPSNFRSDARCPSPYDNIREDEEIDATNWHSSVGLCPPSPSAAYTSRSPVDPNMREKCQHRQFICYSESRNTLVGSSIGGDADEKPPLPPKKKHSLITAYVELMHNFDAYSQSHHHHFQNNQKSFHYQRQYTDSAQHMGHVPLHHQYSLQVHSTSCRGMNSFENRYSDMQWSHSPGVSPVDFQYDRHIGDGDLKPVSPSRYIQARSDVARSPGATFDRAFNSDHSPYHVRNSEPCAGNQYWDSEPYGAPPALPPKKNRICLPDLPSAEMVDATPIETFNPSVVMPPSSLNVTPVTDNLVSPLKEISEASPLQGSKSDDGKSISLGSPQRCSVEENPDIYLTEPKSLLVMNDGTATASKPNSDGPDVKGGDPLVLISYAASPSLSDTKFREVFLLTYRSFVRPFDVVHLLWKRYQFFEKKTDRVSVSNGRSVLELFVDVVKCLTPMDLEEAMVTKVRDCIYYLVRNGEMLGALKARKGLITKFAIRNKLLSAKPTLTSLAVTAVPQTLLQWSATSIAQQMTLLDADLFRQLEPAELLVWAREQSEDFCPALNNFTEHFNKVSYWARSKVLTCVTSRERNRTMKKLIEVMRKLREYNNFNSLLAVLAALDSAPIRRLGFSRRLTEALKPHAALTDSSGSFRTYRQALAESKPPCIPYLGLVLQDLTFVHIGNVDFLNDGKVNWIKRCQQWLVLEPIRRFHSCQYSFVRNDSLLTFLNNFDETLNDDDLWQLSKKIKP